MRCKRTARSRERWFKQHIRRRPPATEVRHETGIGIGNLNIRVLLRERDYNGLANRSLLCELNAVNSVDNKTRMKTCKLTILDAKLNKVDALNEAKILPMGAVASASDLFRDGVFRKQSTHSHIKSRVKFVALNEVKMGRCETMRQ